jgi:predicted transcriptional regulator
VTKKKHLKKQLKKKYVNPHIGKGQNTKENVEYRRQVLVSLLGSGKNVEEISKILKVSIDTIYKDKSELSKQGLIRLQELGSSELTFYYATLINDNNNLKKFLWSIINSTNGNNAQLDNNNKEEIITLDHKLKASRTIMEINEKLGNIYNSTVSNIILPEYTKKLNNIEDILRQENLLQDNKEENNKKSSFMNIQRPKLTKDIDKPIEDNSNNDNDNVDKDNVM